MASTEHDLRVTIAALLHATGETQRDLAAGIGLSQALVSRRQAGERKWTLTDIDRLSAHYEIPVVDLLAGADHAVRRLPAHRRAATLGGTQTTIPASAEETPR